MTAAQDRNAVPSAKPRLVCFSHLRWNFVFQRPQHVMTRLAAHYDIIFWEEALPGDGAPALDLSTCSASGVTIATPRLDPQLEGEARDVAKRALLVELTGGAVDVAWFYAPMMLSFARDLPRRLTIYDCMDELANFAGAPAMLRALEAELLAASDVVFTGGASLYAAKRTRHSNVHCFPSGVDVAHFARARAAAPVAAPTIGYFGVIDERIDLDLIAALADARPDWTIEMVGPVAKIDEATLPDRPNILWAGQQDYGDLPAWLARWSVAIMPFALNDATRFISPTKAPEYLAGGRPVVSTAIADVAKRFPGITGVKIARSVEDFIDACAAQHALAQTGDWLGAVDTLLADASWDATVEAMRLRLTPRLAPVRGKPHYDVLVVGAGFAGAVMAERLAADGGKRVLVIDRRPHIGGNAYDRHDASGILMHQYGPHIFHTNSDEVASYLSRFTAWRPYEHRVLAQVQNGQVPIPINRTTLNKLYGLSMTTDDEAAAFLATRAEPVDVVRTSEDVVVDKVGRELYELFFRGYTRKQWGLDPSELDKSVTARVPTRTNDDDRYFTDSFQAMPRDGYTRMFAAILDHPNIALRLGTDFDAAADLCTWDHLVFTGPIDAYFGYRFGRLPYRSLRFQHCNLDTEWFQPVGTVNYPSVDVPYTRITEYKHLTGQDAPTTTITYEYPQAEGDPYYPIPRDENQALFRRYRDLADSVPDVTFVGRLASYRYYNMDQVVAQALAVYRRLKASGFSPPSEEPVSVAA